MKLCATVNDVNIYEKKEFLGLDNDIAKAESIKCVVDYEIQSHVSEDKQSVKAIDIIINQVRALVKWSVPVAELTENEKIHLTLQMRGIIFGDEIIGMIAIASGLEFKVQNSLEFEPHGALSISCVGIDLFLKKIEVA